MIEVLGYGPMNAKLFFVGEGPGRNEELKGRPFVGMTGNFVRRIIDKAGMDPEDVRWNNAMPVRVKPTPSLLKKYWSHLQQDLNVVRPIATVACGSAALQRLLHKTGIKEAHGGIYVTPSLGVVVPTLHPAAVRGKIQSEKLLCEKAITRAVKYATGELTYAPTTPEVKENPLPQEVDKVLRGASVVVVDTEFNPAKRETFCVGFTVDGKVVYSIGGVTRGMGDVLRHHFARKDLRKVAHHHFADVKALAWLGVDSSAPWFDTLITFATLYPDLPCGLSHVARFYLDDVSDWKHMDKDDPLYNAIDVVHTWRIYQCEIVELAEANMWELMEEEVIPTLPLLYGLEERGLKVDRPTLRRMQKQAKRDCARMRKALKGEVDALFENRRAPLEGLIRDSEAAIGTINNHAKQGGCEEHPTYVGIRAKKFTKSSSKCCCKIVYVSMADQRTSIASLRLEITKAKGKLKRWERGFEPGNNDHVRWLLYDKCALGLRVQKNRETGRATADATAVAKLLSLKTVQRKAGAVSILQSIKQIQKLEKRLSTFLFDSKAGKKSLGKYAVVHPQYRMRAGTGRPASGDDPYLEEKGVSSNKFNVLNIPEEVRVIYVPHE